jgi:hypothetical protein
MSNETPETCTMNIKGYIPVFRTMGTKDDWKPIPVSESRYQGVPTPALFGHALRLVGCFGHAQAVALSWLWVAECEANGERYAYEVGIERKDIQIETSSKRELTLVLHPEKPDESMGDIYTPTRKQDKP